MPLFPTTSARRWWRMLVATALLARALLAHAALEVNLANQAELETIQGVGPGLSEAILAERGVRPFQDWRDFIARLSGIGPSRAAKLSAAGLQVAGQGYVVPATTPAKAPASQPF